MPYRATAAVCRRSDVGWRATGKQCCAAVVPAEERTGTEWAGLLSDGSLRFAFSIPTLARALTLCIEGKSRMRENRMYGSVRGASGDRCPYRDRLRR
jgi:hypothetical protein